MKRWQNKLIAHLFGVQGVLDEQRMALIGRASINAVLGIVAFEFVMAIAGIMLPIHDYENAYAIELILQLLGPLWIIALTISLAVHKAGGDRREVTAAAYPQAQRRVRRKWLLMMPVLAVSYHLVNSLFSINQQPLVAALFDGKRLLCSCGFAILFCAAMYLYEREQIKIVKDEF
ncbi:DUF3278 domain-containing protein [Lacticaseibacillus sp. GG6-2]